MELLMVFILAVALPVLAYMAYVFLPGVISERRAKKEAEKRWRQQQKLHDEAAAYYTSKYAGKSPEELAGVPEGCAIGSDGLPFSDRGAGKWGEPFTFYYSPSGKVYHLRSCRACLSTYTPVNAYDLYQNRLYKNLSPCKLCSPRLPDMSWVWKYPQIKEIKENLHIE